MSETPVIEPDGVVASNEISLAVAEHWLPDGVIEFKANEGAGDEPVNSCAPTSGELVLFPVFPKKSSVIAGVVITSAPLSACEEVPLAMAK